MMYSLSNDTWDEEEISAAHKVIDSRLFTIGKYVKQYEQEFAEIWSQICGNVKFRFFCQSSGHGCVGLFRKGKKGR